MGSPSEVLAPVLRREERRALRRGRCRRLHSTGGPARGPQTPGCDAHFGFHESQMTFTLLRLLQQAVAGILSVNWRCYSNSLSLGPTGKETQCGKRSSVNKSRFNSTNLKRQAAAIFILLRLLLESLEKNKPRHPILCLLSTP